ncbi:MAG: N-acetyl-gamma-glutamyl-phosphate reductase [Rhodothalassiaceae bacterium]
MPQTKTLRAGVLGASGYTGADLLRLLHGHPAVDIALVSGGRRAGEELGRVLPSFAPWQGATLTAMEAIDWPTAEIDLVFCALPHGATQAEVTRIRQARPELPIIDLSADFRLRDAAVYQQWYGLTHCAPALLASAVYGLSEWARDALRTADLIACPGCYPTAALLALLPILDLVDCDEIAIDAKSGVSGAGRGLKDANLFCEVAEAIHPYGLGGHRHMPEIEQELALRLGRDLRIGFTPHLVPINRGELETIYLRLQPGVDAADVYQALADRYAAEPFVHVLEEAVVPATRMVRGSNHCVLNVFQDRRPGRAILVAAIDNLVKGSSGQAVQNMNIRFDWPEGTGLQGVALFP